MEPPKEEVKSELLGLEKAPERIAGWCSSHLDD